MYVKGDTLYIYKYRDRWREKIVRDTSYIIKTDSVEIPVYIEKKLRIFNERFHKVFTNVIPINNGKLYPCAIVDINDNERAIEFFELMEMEEDDDIPIINII